MGLFKSKNKPKGEAQSTTGSVSLDDGSTLPVAQRVDCLGDSCPRPQLMTKKAVASAGSGEVVEVLIDNPTSMEALPPMCSALAATHLLTRSGEKGWHVYIQKN